MVAAPALAAPPEPRGELWWFTTWQITDKVWPISKGADVTVAVVDSGVNAKLPEFRGVVLKGHDARRARGDGRTDFDDGGEERSGWGHGTGMAAIIAGQGGRSGMVGVAPESRVLPIAAGDLDDHYIEGIRYAADHGARIINVSAGWNNPFGAERCPVAMQEVVDYALQQDAVVVAAAGNTKNGPADAPASCPGVLTVGAVDHTFRPWKNTSEASYVDVAAPGVRVGTIGKRGKFRVASGTSPSAALTSAAATLVRSRYPEMSAREVVQRLVATAMDVGPKGRDDRTGFGLLRPYRALTEDVPADAPNPVFEAWDRSRKERTATVEPPASMPPASAGGGGIPREILMVTAAASAGMLLAVVIGGLLLVQRRRRRRHT